MIKLSLFMLNPVRAHALYTQEITALNDELILAKAEALLAKKEQKAMYKTMKEKVRQQDDECFGVARSAPRT